MLFSQKLLRRILGVLWLIDAIFQVQPQMFTSNMIDNVLLPTLSSQPGPVAASLHMIVLTISSHLLFFNLLIAIVQAEIGLFLLAGFWVRGTVILSIVWSLIVWYGGEGMNMLLTGQASILTGAPGAVLLYPLLGLLIYPRKAAGAKSDTDNGASSLLPQKHFYKVLAGFWIFAGLLQLQPYWWQPGQISQSIGDMVAMGGFDSVLVDPVLHPISVLAVNLEIPLNIILILLFLGLGIGLLMNRSHWLRPLLITSLLLSFLIWWIAQGFGAIFTGMATDFNSGLLLMLMTLVSWPRLAPQHAAQTQPASRANLPTASTQLAEPATS
ncbi:MAG TPA: hypothetical protein VFV38_19285 [Ktedonobacteraceae bacterium]|nr:hypothetical protein [Ktedonobacteraceae bacterium]